jgi:hypothetical protein
MPCGTGLASKEWMLPPQGCAMGAEAWAGARPAAPAVTKAALLVSKGDRGLRPYHTKQSGRSWHAQQAALLRPSIAAAEQIGADRCCCWCVLVRAGACWCGDKRPAASERRKARKGRDEQEQHHHHHPRGWAAGRAAQEGRSSTGQGTDVLRMGMGQHGHGPVWLHPCGGFQKT